MRILTNKKTSELGTAMERIHLPLQEYTQAQKLDLLETIWDDVTKNEGDFESPNWHEPIVKASLIELENGKAEVSDWSEAKKRIKRNVQCKDQMGSNLYP